MLGLKDSLIQPHLIGGVIGTGENTGGIILSTEFPEELNELLPDDIHRGKSILNIVSRAVGRRHRSDNNPVVNNISMNIDVTVKKKFCIEKNEKFYEISMKQVKAVLKNVTENVDDVNRAFALLAMQYVICPP
ncbi:hypothetical protein Tco_0537862 [Tanacetum coccineum]